MSGKSELIFLLNGTDGDKKSKPFILKGQATLVAYGLFEDYEIHFEQILTDEGRLPIEVCCEVLPAIPAATKAVVKMRCPTCETAHIEYVRMTSRNPQMVLDFAESVILRAVVVRKKGGPFDSLFNGIILTLNSETKVKDLTPAMRGCPPVCCEDYEQIWVESGAQRCNIETNKLERQFVSNCGNIEWREVRDLNWQETGNTKCENHKVVAQEVNDCGDFRWTETAKTCDWSPSFRLPCEGLAYSDDDDLDPEASVKVENCKGEMLFHLYPKTKVGVTTPVIAGCASRSIIGYAVDSIHAYCAEEKCEDYKATKWQETGVSKCEGHVVKNQEVNGYGELRWVTTEDSCGWVPTFRFPCEGLGFTPDNERDPAATVEIKDCEGEVIAYVYPKEQEGITTPIVVGCTGEGEEIIGFAVDKVHNCENGCNTINQDWVSTGLEKCADHELLEQEVNRDGLLRWVKTGSTCGWVPTFRFPCEGLGFSPEDKRDPAATVEIKDCKGKVIAYAYQHPMKGVTTPIITGCGLEGSIIVAYAVDKVHTCEETCSG